MGKIIHELLSTAKFDPTDCKDIWSPIYYKGAVCKGTLWPYYDRNEITLTITPVNDQFDIGNGKGKSVEIIEYMPDHPLKESKELKYSELDLRDAFESGRKISEDFSVVGIIKLYAFKTFEEYIRKK